MPQKNKIIIIIFVVLSFIYMIVNIITTTNGKSSYIGKPMPAFEVKDMISNEIITSDNLKGKVIFLNFWATWCRPCIDEMPIIHNLYKRLKNEKDFKMITVVFKDNERIAIQYLKENNFEIPLFTDPSGKSAINYDVRKVPETYIVNKKGIVTQAVQGFSDWTAPENINHLLGLIKE